MDETKTQQSLKRFIVVFVLLIGLGIGIVLAFQLRNGVLYWLAMPYPIGFWQPSSLPTEEVWFRSKDGQELHGWYLVSMHPRGVLLFVHGSGGNITWRAEVLRRLNQDLGLTVLIFDYRGYGRSRGNPDEFGLYQDAAGAYSFLATKAMADENDIIVFGESLGGAVAIDLVAKRQVKGLILADTFPAIADLMPYYPRLPAFAWAGQVYNSAEKIKKYHGPLLMKHGDADTVAPFALAEKLFSLANGPKQMIVQKGGRHDERDEDFFIAIRDFVGSISSSNPK